MVATVYGTNVRKCEIVAMLSYKKDSLKALCMWNGAQCSCQSCILCKLQQLLSLFKILYFTNAFYSTKRSYGNTVIWHAS